MVKLSRWLGSVALLSGCLGQLAVAQTERARVDSILEPWTRGRTPGAAVMVIKDGRIVHERGYGLADVSTGKPIDPHTKFLLGSVSKQFTAMAVMILAERGRLSYDDPLRKFFPQFPSFADSITVRHLLHHVAGFPEYEGLFVTLGRVDADWPRSVTTPRSRFEPTARDALELLAEHGTPRFPVGSRFDYSNSGYMILAQIVEQVSGQRFAEFLRRNVFDRLGMRESVLYDETTPPIPGRASSYTADSTGYREIDYTPFNHIYGEDNVVAPLHDLFRWNQALESNRLVSRATLDLAFTPGRLVDGSPTTYGFGWTLGTSLGVRVVSHGGSWLGFRNVIRRYPDQRLTVIVLSNLAQLDAETVAAQIAGIYLGDAIRHRVGVVVAPARLADLAGRYAFGSRRAMVERVGEELVFQSPFGRNRLRFDSDSTAFFADNEALGLTFRAGPDGRIRELVFHHLEFDLKGIRVPDGL